MLPTLIAWVEAEHTRAADLLAAAEATAPGAVFTTSGETLRRAVMSTPATGRVWVDPPTVDHAAT